MSDRQRVAVSALAVAMQAKCGEVNTDDLTNLMVRVDQYLESSDPLARAVIGFQVQMELNPDRDTLRTMGAELHDRLSVILRPDPPDIGRRDIHG